MQLHVGVDQLPLDSPSGSHMNRVLQLMRNVTEEDRNAVRGLRSSGNTVTSDLELAFSRVQQELGVPSQADFRVVVDGRPRPLHPVIRDEVYRIGRKALVNSFRHVSAKNVEVEVEYAGKQLYILVRDDGRGIDPQILHSGREGHWGLQVCANELKKSALGLSSKAVLLLGPGLNLQYLDMLLSNSYRQRIRSNGSTVLISESSSMYSEKQTSSQNK